MSINCLHFINLHHTCEIIQIHCVFTINNGGSYATLKLQTYVDICSKMFFTSRLIYFTYKLIDRLYRIDRLIYIIKVCMFLSIWLSFNVTDEHSRKLTSLYTVYRSHNNQKTHFSVLQVYIWPLGIVKFCTVPVILLCSNVIITDSCVIILDFNLLYEWLTNIRIGRISVLLLYMLV
jgi:hypothetical protein